MTTLLPWTVSPNSFINDTTFKPTEWACQEFKTWAMFRADLQQIPGQNAQEISQIFATSLKPDCQSDFETQLSSYPNRCQVNPGILEKFRKKGVRILKFIQGTEWALKPNFPFFRYDFSNSKDSDLAYRQEWAQGEFCLFVSTLLKKFSSGDMDYNAFEHIKISFDRTCVSKESKNTLAGRLRLLQNFTKYYSEKEIEKLEKKAAKILCILSCWRLMVSYEATT